MLPRRRFIKVIGSLFSLNFLSKKSDENKTLVANKREHIPLQQTIRESIEQANIQKHYKPWYGDCWHIAVALYDIYPQVYIRGTEWKSSSWDGPGHVFVEYDGTYYDGTGVVTIDKFKDKWTDMVPEAKSYNREFITDVVYYEKDKKENIERLIKETKAYKNWRSNIH
jgi:hypothetical protein